MATTVILGSGIIGLSTAYYLADHQPGSTIHLVDSSPELFASASGYAGGFVASGGWFGRASASLGQLSFDEHRALAERHGGRERWGYSRTVTVSYDPRGPSPAPLGGAGDEDWLRSGSSRAELVRRGDEEDGGDGTVPPWLRRYEGDVVRVVDNGEGTAIVDPLELCRFLLERCRAMGVHVHHPATALNVATDMRGHLAGVRIGYTDSSTELEIPATRVLLSSGAWTPQVFGSLFRDSPIDIPVSTLGGHSLVVKMPPPPAGTTDNETCHAVYASLGSLSPELYARTNGVIYLAGVNSPEIPLPQLATCSEPLEPSLDTLRRVAQRLIATGEGDGELEIVRAGLCFRPITDRGTPILARIDEGQLGSGIGTRPGADGGVFLAVGHGPWGISLSLGTGKVMAEMMQGRELSSDVSKLGL